MRGSSTTLGRMPGAGRSKLQSVTCGLVVLAIALVAAGCGGGGSDDSQTTPGCGDVDAPAPRDDGGETAPAQPLDASQTWTLTFDTSCGQFVLTLDLDSAPNTAASLVSLARAGYFDDTLFHRIVPGFVIQGGDPTQSGSGGPGYSTVDPPPAGAAYTKGVVAMAKTATEPAGTAGSQFFVVTGADAGLPPEYAVVGKVTDGLDVVERIGKLGDPASEQPTQPVVIDSVTVGSHS
jgi:peptidyl-prolyl cis-trans isomerase B (cyclophilin B)